jgi:hypothetical protein
MTNPRVIRPITVHIQQLCLVSEDVRKEQIDTIHALAEQTPT